ncbi:MAG TPA: nuclear transport factor 2 family protein [Kineosporiaceae bacterium]|nr:nuclear transport factor 2 family protein [Kineosporiaceae bacterium]
MTDDDTRRVIERFHEAFNEHDVPALEGLISEDCMFEDTSPPDGVRHVGRRAVADAWRQFFVASPDAEFEVEEVVTAGDRAVVRWLYRWTDGHVRGVDLMRVRGGLVTESIAYVKG